MLVARASSSLLVYRLSWCCWLLLFAAVSWSWFYTALPTLLSLDLDRFSLPVPELLHWVHSLVSWFLCAQVLARSVLLLFVSSHDSGGGGGGDDASAAASGEDDDELKEVVHVAFTLVVVYAALFAAYASVMLLWAVLPWLGVIAQQQQQQQAERESTSPSQALVPTPGMHSFEVAPLLSQLSRLSYFCVAMLVLASVVLYKHKSLWTGRQKPKSRSVVVFVFLNHSLPPLTTCCRSSLSSAYHPLWILLLWPPSAA